MQKISVTFLPGEAEQLAEKLIDQLDPQAKLRLSKRLDRETRRLRWAPLLSLMRQRFAKRPLSPRQIRQLCEQVRQEQFERRARRR